MHIAIIGAGSAGLASARHALANGFKCDVFEMGEQLGGTWVYTDDVGTDRYGFPVYSAMYKGLRTNLPKEIMGFPDFPIPERNKSYLTQAEILDFLNLYADYFNLKPCIKFNTMVMDVRPIADNKWQITTIHKPTKIESVQIYDGVMICNGHYNDPIVPEFKGQEKFAGLIEHSHKYRSPESFTGKRVLVVGAGPSGLDLTLHMSTVAKNVVLSHHSPEPINTKYPSNVNMKPDILCIKNSEEVQFVDGTCCCFDAILLCTGYKYNFPFLHESCGITVDDNHIKPLYKHMIHINRPTMCFIGIPFQVCTFHMFDLQVRFYCKYMNGDMKLPTTDMMLKHTEQEVQNRLAKGYNKRQMHMMGPDQESYYNDLAADANTSTIAPVYVKLRNESIRRLQDDLLNFREDRYKIIDQQNYIKVQ